MGFRAIEEIPFLNISEAKIIKMNEYNSSILFSKKGLSITKTHKEKKFEVPFGRKQHCH